MRGSLKIKGKASVLRLIGTVFEIMEAMIDIQLLTILIVRDVCNVPVIGYCWQALHYKLSIMSYFNTLHYSTFVNDVTKLAYNEVQEPFSREHVTYRIGVEELLILNYCKLYFTC